LTASGAIGSLIGTSPIQYSFIIDMKTQRIDGNVWKQA
jgi:hypothetical protein